ncbi:hypothetical protein [Embleya scabrispora]|uniref:hypothetical protein n=1 Tax=Embleya scabrispora TaxID=159449 RepID=UPI00037FFF46|nr:hypothetical protein [Embleya scabrispora]MYS87724.1 hypothetical protein [Streptomyces sp. SID5474]
MCEVDHEAAAVAAVARLVAAHPHLAQGPCSHPALAGCEDVVWTAIPGCPEGVPVVLRGLLDPEAAEETERALGWVVMSGPLNIGMAMAAVLPFLLRLAADPEVPRRDELFDLVLVAAALSEPTDPDNAWALAIGGREEDHPERALCRAAFVTDAAWVRRLLDDDALLASASLRDDDHASLRAAAGL